VSDKDELLYENMRHLDFLKIDHLRTELAKRTAERDEARREYCEARADLRSTPTSPEVIAANRGWDCFTKENSQS
jgi:hypothetical protein